MEELCTGCLTPRSGLRFLDEEKTRIYLGQLPEDLRMELMSIKFSFCFCCSAMIQKMCQFQRLTTWAMHKLLSYHDTLSLGDLSDRPYFSQMNITKELIIDIPSEFTIRDIKTEQSSQHDIFNQNKNDNIKTENTIDVDIFENNIIENDITENDIDACDDDTDYHCEPGSYVNDLLLSELNKYTENDKESIKKVITSQEISSKEQKPASSKESKKKKVLSKSLKTKTIKNTSKNFNKKLSTKKKSNKKTIVETFDDNKNHHSEANKDVILENDNLRIEHDNTNNDTKPISSKTKAVMIKVTLNKSQIREDRRKMTYNSDYALSHFKCKNCIIGFETITDYDKHFAEYHDQKLGPHACTVCSRRFAERSLLDEHSREHSVRFACSLCDVTERSERGMEAHLLEHAQFECELCGCVCGTSLLQQVHMNKAHGRKLQCTLCDKAFSSAKTLGYHLKVLHKGQNRYPCPHCGKVYQWKSNLFRHIKNHKAQSTGELYCSLCDKSFSSVATYRQHLAINKRHATPQQYSFSCSECDKRFLLKRDLTDHVNWEHLHKAVHVCVHCSKPFKSYMALYLHQNVHKDPSERGNLCHLCGKCYPTQSKLKSHLLAKHSDEMPYKCSLCDAAFNWYSSLYRHAHKLHGLTKEQYKINKPKLPEEEVSAPVE